MLVEALLQRGSGTDLREARAAIERLAAAPTDTGFVLQETWLMRLRALLAQAHGDENAYRDWLPHDGHRPRFRMPYEVSRGDAVTAVVRHPYQLPTHAHQQMH